MIDKLIKQVSDYFTQINDKRRPNTTYALADCLMGAFAMFSLKDSSLLVFRANLEQRAANLQRIFGMGEIPEDSAFRAAIDVVEPKELHGLFPQLIDTLKEENHWDNRKVLDGFTTVSVDATGHYCSNKKQCPQCMVRILRNGNQQFYHQQLAAVQTHPDHKEVFPMATEAIVLQDGHTKNDCEQNAAKRLLPRIRSQYLSEKILYLMDALYGTGPMIRLILAQNASFIIGIKEGYVMIQKAALLAKNQLSTYHWSNGKVKGTARYTNGLMLNGQHQDILVNYVEYEEVDLQTGKVLFFSSWITNLPITLQNVKTIVRVARCRWKIENETFNTLKNQGYHLEHNYGHGKQYLATNLAQLTFLVFLVDQIVQVTSSAFLAAWKASRTKTNLWEKIRQVFDLIPAISMNAIYSFIAKKLQIDYPLLI